MTMWPGHDQLTRTKRYTMKDIPGLQKNLARTIAKRTKLIAQFDALCQQAALLRPDVRDCYLTQDKITSLISRISTGSDGNSNYWDHARSRFGDHGDNDRAAAVSAAHSGGGASSGAASGGSR